MNDIYLTFSAAEGAPTVLRRLTVVVVSTSRAAVFGFLPRNDIRDAPRSGGGATDDCRAWRARVASALRSSALQLST